MTNYFDELETRNQQTRQQALIETVAAQVAHAKAHAPAYSKILAAFDPADITSPEAIAQLPVTRKSSLIELQEAAKPFGGLAAVEAPELAMYSRRPDRFTNRVPSAAIAGVSVGPCLLPDSDPAT